MRTTIIIAAHNEGDALWKTVRACVETCVELDYEIVIADDASVDDSIEEVQRRFPQVRVVRLAKRCGAAPTKNLGARAARGEVLVFLDGHCNPEQGAIARLVGGVEDLNGDVIVTPAVVGLDVRRWRNTSSQIGHGYFLDLEKFDCGWLPLSELRGVDIGRRRFYESPALIGCALAVSRELYEDLWGFDHHMLMWGVEDLDFGLKVWLMGHSILHDPEAVVGHRFRESFDNYEVPVEHPVINQLRMARKNFTHGVWSDWVDRSRLRHPGRLLDHPEGLWARAWELFEEQRASVEQERAYLQARRIRDEFWYAERFGLTWPRLRSAPAVFAPPGAQALALQASPTPPPKRRLVLMIGAWPPTDIGIEARHGMLWKWQKLQENYKGSGYDVQAVAPMFPAQLGWVDNAKTDPYWGKGQGELTVDYRKTSQDFWGIVLARHPIAIMSFSRGLNNNEWLIEWGRNLAQLFWVIKADYQDMNGKPQTDTWPPPFPGGSKEDFSPYKGQGAKDFNPPDITKNATTRDNTDQDMKTGRPSNLPAEAIIAAIEKQFPKPPGKIVPSLNAKATANGFVSEYRCYHACWYRDYSKEKFDKAEQCLIAGHVHVGIKVTVPDAETAVDIQLDQLFAALKKL